MRLLRTILFFPFGKQAQASHELGLGIGWILHCGASAQCEFIFFYKHSLKISASHLSFCYFFSPCMASRSAQGEWLCSWRVRYECLWRPFFARRMGGWDKLQRLLSWACPLLQKIFRPVVEQGYIGLCLAMFLPTVRPKSYLKGKHNPCSAYG